MEYRIWRWMERSVFKVAVLQLAEAFFADDLAMEKLGIVHTSAENTSGFIFFEHDGIFVYKDFNGILATKGKVFSDFDGKNDSSELVDASDDSCRFHRDDSSEENDLLMNTV